MLTGSDSDDAGMSVRLQQIDECPLCDETTTYIYKVRDGQQTPKLAVGEQYPHHVTARVCCGDEVAFYHIDVRGGDDTSDFDSDESDVNSPSVDFAESLYDTHG
jgi:hypothetical protein